MLGSRHVFAVGVVERYKMLAAEVNSLTFSGNDFESCKHPILSTTILFLQLNLVRHLPAELLSLSLNEIFLKIHS